MKAIIINSVLEEFKENRFVVIEDDMSEIVS